MANFRGKSTKAVDLTVAAYDKSVAKNKETGEVTAQYVTAGVHPDSELAQGQTLLALNSKRDEKSKSGYNNSAPYSPSQMDKIKEAAGDNVAPLLDREGNEVGKIYGVKADLLPARDKSGFAINTNTLQASSLSVQPEANGRDIQTKIVESQREAKAAKEAAGPEVDGAEAPEAQAEAETEQQLG